MAIFSGELMQVLSTVGTVVALLAGGIAILAFLRRQAQVRGWRNPEGETRYIAYLLVAIVCSMLTLMSVGISSPAQPPWQYWVLAAVYFAALVGSMKVLFK